MTEEFNLSDKRQDRKHPNFNKPYNNEFTYSEEDVKEFIRLLKENLLAKSFRVDNEGWVIDTDKIVRKNMINEIDKLAGKKLIEK